MRRLLGILALVAMGTAACHNSARPAAECMADAPVVAYGGVVPPPTDVVWYVPPPYYDNAPYYDDNDSDNSSSGGGTYYDDGTGSTGDGWDTSDEPVDDPAPPPSGDTGGGSSDDGWDDPDPARTVQTKTLVGERAPNGCYVCQLVCTGGTSGGAVTATGASSHSYDRACLYAANRMQYRYAVTACMNVQPQQN